MKYIIQIYSLLGLLMLVACSQQETLPEEEKQEGIAEVSFSLSVPQVESRTLADGQYFKEVTVLILNNQNELEAFEDMTLTGEEDEVEITFDKTFNTGEYTLMAVANYTHLADFKTLVDGFKNGTKSYNDLLSYQLNAGDDGVCSDENPQPLTLIQPVELHPGQNIISGDMLRTYARIRIEVRNQSETNDLTVNSLSFSDNFAQKNAYIWQGQGFLSDSRITVNQASTDAITPFTSAITIPAIATNTDGTTTVNSSVVFDGYILESEETNDAVDYTYRLDVSYGSDQLTVTDTYFTGLTNIRNNYDGYYFLIQNVRRSGFMYDNNGSVYQGETLANLKSNIANKTEYLWELESTGTQDCYRIKNVKTGKYIGNPSSTQSAVSLIESPGNNYFRFYNYGSSYSDFYSQGIQMQYNGNGQYTCLNDNQGIFICGYSLNDAGNHFKFHCVEKSIRYNTPIVLQTINKETARVEDVRRINRNDFIKVLVTVSYNEDTGSFEFDVKPWNTGGGDITFE